MLPPEERAGPLDQAIATIDAAVGDPHPGLPLPVFHLMSRLLPIFCVDVWIEDDRGRVLLTWREDEHFGRGWHVPGSALRFGERAADRLRLCAREELGAEILPEPVPFTLQEEIMPGARTRGHNVAAAYRSRLLSPPDPAREYRGGRPVAGQWAWHDRYPADILPVHRGYALYFPVRETVDEPGQRTGAAIG